MNHQIRSYLLLFLFLFGMLVPGQTQEELTRLPVLLNHFQAHKSQYPSTSFGDFLQLHYSDDFAQHRSAHDHSKLPMKSGDNHLHAPALVDLPALVSARFQVLPCVNNATVYSDQTYSFLLLNDIWQPPKSC